jgi:hypothetical protein
MSNAHDEAFPVLRYLLFNCCSPSPRAVILYG